MKIEALEAPKAKARQEATQAKPGQKVGSQGGVPRNTTLGTGKKRDIAGKAIGMSASNYGRAKSVVVAADEHPENEVIQEAKKEMNETGNVRSSYRKVREQIPSNYNKKKDSPTKASQKPGLSRSENTPKTK